MLGSGDDGLRGDREGSFQMQGRGRSQAPPADVDGEEWVLLLQLMLSRRRRRRERGSVSSCCYSSGAVEEEVSSAGCRSSTG